MSQTIVGTSARAIEQAAYGYELFGLMFQSTEPVPGLVPSELPAEGTVRIEFGRTPAHVVDAEFVDEVVRVSARQFLFTLPGVMRMFVEEDFRIVVERLDHSDAVQLWTTILGAGSSVVGFRRGYIPLHAASVVTDEGCIAFAGQSGAGKSTLAAALMARGFELFADDLSLVQANAAGQPFVGRGVLEVRLWEDAVAALNLQHVAPFAIQRNVNKFVFRHVGATGGVAPLRRIYALDFADDANPAGIYRLTGVAAMQSLLGRLRIRMGLLAVGEKQRTFERLAAIAEKVEVFRFVRPLDHAQSGPWLDQLVAHFSDRTGTS